MDACRGCVRLLLVAWQVNMDNKWLLLSEFIFRATLVAVAIASICVRFGLLEVSCGRTVKLAGVRRALARGGWAGRVNRK